MVEPVLLTRWCAEGELAELWRAVGLGSVRFGALAASARYADFEDLWSPLPTGVGPAGAFCKWPEEDDRAALRDASADLWEWLTVHSG